MLGKGMQNDIKRTVKKNGCIGDQRWTLREIKII